MPPVLVSYGYIDGDVVVVVADGVDVDVHVLIYGVGDLNDSIGYDDDVVGRVVFDGDICLVAVCVDFVGYEAGGLLYLFEEGEELVVGDEEGGSSGVVVEVAAPVGDGFKSARGCGGVGFRPCCGFLVEDVARVVV